MAKKNKTTDNSTPENDDRVEDVMEESGIEDLAGEEEVISEDYPAEDNAEEIYKQLITSGEDVGLATIYRVLTQFESAGIVMRHNFEEGHAVYEITPDDHHDHMVCLETGNVIEFHDELIEKRQEEITKEMGYEIVDHSMVLYVKPIK